MQWKGFELHPEVPPEGSPRPPLPDERWRALNDNMARMAAEEGLEMNRPEMRSNSHLALVAGAFARDRGRAEPFNSKMFEAYWRRQLNIGQREVVLEVARESGLNAAALAQAMDDGRYEPELARNMEEAHSYGINGVPTFLFGRYMVVGAQPYEVLERALALASRDMAET